MAFPGRRTPSPESRYLRESAKAVQRASCMSIAPPNDRKTIERVTLLPKTQ
jgi:hypothetical protein